MKFNMKKLLLMGLCALLFLGCLSYTPTAKAYVYISQYSVNLYTVNAPSLGYNNSTKLTLTSYSSTNVYWTTSNSSVATVTSDGTVTARGAGTCKIYARNNNSSSDYDYVNVTVTAVQMPERVKMYTPATTLTLYRTYGGTKQLTAKVLPETSTNTSLIWTSSKPGVATVSSTGFVTAQGVGSTTITATSALDGSLKATVSIKVVGKQPTSLKLNRTSTTLKMTSAGAATLQLTPTFAPGNSIIHNVKYTSSNSNVAKVNGSGKVTAVGPGTATITCTSRANSALKATCKVTVQKVQPTKFTLSDSTLTLNAHSSGLKSKKLTYKYSPSNSYSFKVVWTSSNPSVAKVNGSGTVTALKAGTTTITMALKGKTSIKATCKVTVVNKQAYTSVKLNQSSATLFKVVSSAQSFTLKATTSPSNASDSLVWTSSDTKVAKVNSSGKVTAVGSGTATITCASKLNPNKKASCKVTVSCYDTNYDFYISEIKPEMDNIYNVLKKEPDDIEGKIDSVVTATNTVSDMIAFCPGLKNTSAKTYIKKIKGYVATIEERVAIQGRENDQTLFNAIENAMDTLLDLKTFCANKL